MGVGREVFWGPSCPQGTDGTRVASPHVRVPGVLCPCGGMARVGPEATSAWGPWPCPHGHGWESGPCPATKAAGSPPAGPRGTGRLDAGTKGGDEGGKRCN